MPEKQISADELALEDLRFRIRHSAAHVLADAVLELFPEAKYAIGPPTDEGFYYDFQVDRPFTPSDLTAIETVMRTRISNDHPFILEEVTREIAKGLFANQPYKQEIIDDLPDGEIITTCQHGAFLDLCRGRHVQSTGDIPALKLTTVAGAYWRGDERNTMLQRIYGTAWESSEELEAHLSQLEEASRRDHRRLGKDLDLFSISDQIGGGLVLWHPKGSIVRSLMEQYSKDEHHRRGYQQVYSPHIGRSSLWATSGHLEFFKENMYDSMDVEGQEYYAKPMNCPFHIEVYRAGLRSYRELPIRYSELGTVYRYERGGVLHGLLRVRGFTQDDAHIFCTEEQVENEIVGVLDFTFDLLSAFGFANYEIFLSTKPEKAVGSDDLWRHATKALANAMDSRGLEYLVDEGGGAFYGPKVDVKVRDAIGRSWQCSTIQFDFNLPDRFDITYVGSDGSEHRPYMVHRALFGSVERFFGILVEHYGGAFPVWLSPIQAIVIPIADRHLTYSEEVVKHLSDNGIRATADIKNERMNAKIRDAQLKKIPYMLVVGDKEIEQRTVSTRTRAGADLGALTIEEITTKIIAIADSKTDSLT